MTANDGGNCGPRERVFDAAYSCCKDAMSTKIMYPELWHSCDACGVSSCGIRAGRRPPLGSSHATVRSVISEGGDGA